MDRETQKSEIYFTNHTLTGKPNAFPWLGSDTARRFQRAVRCSPSLFHQLHFDWEAGGLFVLEVRRRPCDSGLSAALSVQEVVSQVLADLYFTNHTLTGKQNAFPFQGSESGLGARVGLLVKLFFARLPAIFISPIAL